jgi:hypothetical protein
MKITGCRINSMDFCKVPVGHAFRCNGYIHIKVTAISALVYGEPVKTVSFNADVQVAYLPQAELFTNE